MMLAMLDAHHERIMVPLRKMEAMDFKAIPEEMESATKQWEQRTLEQDDTCIFRSRGQQRNLTGRL
jgi:hypothetical protein